MCVFLYLSLRSGTQVGRPPRNAREFSLTGRAAHALPAYLADVSPGASACGRLRSQVLIMLLGLRWRYNLTCMRCSSRARCGGALKRRAWHRCRKSMKSFGVVMYTDMLHELETPLNQ